MTLIVTKIKKETRKREAEEGYLSPVQRIDIKLDFIIKRLDQNKNKVL